MIKSTKTNGNYLVFDKEVTIRNKVGSNKASPFCPDNRVVTVKANSSAPGGVLASTVGIARNSENAGPHTLLVGQNIKFDLLWALRTSLFIDGVPIGTKLFHEGAHIWDTQLAEYILTGQESKYASLDAMAKKYGGTVKPDEIKEYWELGVDTDKIPRDKLDDYCQGDVDNTELIFKKQVLKAKELGLTKLIMAMNEALLGYTVMEYNGMKIDVPLCSQLARLVGSQLDHIDKALLDLLPTPPQGYTINLGSSPQLSTFLFGGDIKYEVKEQVGLFKNGNPKIRKVQKLWTNPAWTLQPSPSWETKKPGIYKTSDEVIEYLYSSGEDADGNVVPDVAHKFIGLLRRRRLLAKELQSYYTSLPGLVHADGLIHQNINHTATQTGRVSQNQPNLQNIPSRGDSRAKELFVSRWGTGGRIIEADYKQLEMIALAYLSGDEQLIDDLLHGRDLHAETGKAVFGNRTMTKDERRIIKSINFGLVYGGGANTLAGQAKVSTKLAKKCIQAFHDRYPGVKRWNAQVAEEVKKQRVATREKTPAGRPRGKATYRSISGRLYTFKEYDNNRIWEKGDTVFSHTEMCNYPVQGLATGDIVPLVIGKVVRALMQHPTLRETCLLINTVHDSILFDCREDVLDEAVPFIRDLMEKAPQYFEDVFGTKFDLPLTVEISYGLNWKYQKEV